MSVILVVLAWRLVAMYPPADPLEWTMTGLLAIVSILVLRDRWRHA